MGKNSKQQNAEMIRQYREAKRREEEARNKKQNRMMWQIILGTAAIILLIATVSLLLPLLGIGNNDADNNDNEEGTTNAGVKMEELDMEPIYDFSKVQLTEETTDHVLLNITYIDSNGLKQTGDVIIRLYENVAPLTVKNFQRLVKSGHYDNAPFHRILTGFMIQGGDPNGDGLTDSGEITVKGEFEANGFINNLKHVRGVVSLARSTSYNSGSSQFFIMHGDNSTLDGSYAAFGYVVFGMDTVDGIAGTPVQYGEGRNDANPSEPLTPPVINYASFVTINNTENDTTDTEDVE